MANPTVDTTCIINDPCSVATQGVLDNSIGIATLGWIIRADLDAQPGLPFPNNIGSLLTQPRREWYFRRDSSEPWFGPLSFRDADKHARIDTRDGTPVNVKYAQVGTFLGTRGGDPITEPERVFVALLYANGKPFLREIDDLLL